MRHVNIRSNFKLCLDSNQPGIKYLRSPDSKWIRSCGFIPVHGAGGGRTYIVTADYKSRLLYTGENHELALKCRDEFNRNEREVGNEVFAAIEIGPYLLTENSFRFRKKPAPHIIAEPDPRPHCLLCVGENVTAGSISVSQQTTARIILCFRDKHAQKQADLVAILEPGQQVVFDLVDNRNRVSHSFYRWDGTSIQ